MCKHCHDAHSDAHSHIHNGDCEHTYAHSHESGHSHGHEHGSCGADAAGWRELIPAAISLAGLVFGLCIDHFVGWGSLAALRPLYYFLAFLPVGLPVLREAWEELRGGDVWNEFLLMGVACICAFLIGEFPEAIGVMLFYSVGEWLQDRAVARAHRDIEALVDLRPDVARVVFGTEIAEKKPEDVQVGDVIEVPAGGRVPLDGVLLSESASFDTAALTGESLPRTIASGASVSAGMISLDRSVRLRVEKPYADSALSRIMQMVEEANNRKAPTELFIRRFARIYTPTVMAIALLLAVVPPLVCEGATFSDFIYRACVFLVAACPCAFVIAIPLGYFAGIGKASSRGILFKGGNFLDAVCRLDTVVFDKTGTLTTGAFSVKKILPASGFEKEEILRVAAALEAHSTHPIARAIASAAPQPLPQASQVEEIRGKGLRGSVDGRVVRVGNQRLVENADLAEENSPFSFVYISIDGKFAGAIAVGDTPRAEAREAVERLQADGIAHVAMLSGDREEVVASVASELGVKEFYGALLPEDKAARMEQFVSEGRHCAFVGDGINDAPVLALADVGFAIGAGSDAAVETADVVLQTDNPARVADAIEIGRRTRRLTLLNLALALGVKAVVLLLGLLGIANLWLAAFADTGVTLLCVVVVFFAMRRKLGS